LGAATAASTDEITAGLEKFIAVADTVGLSFEKATASVATIIDKTKQSAEVVGTALKTIFARMEGLSLGETLEDGVNLNKYSEAMKVVGVNVLNANGELKDMDSILDELGARWDHLSRA
jgi:TP901 family phage tail tape measure protein